MVKKMKGLGRGLDALLSGGDEPKTGDQLQVLRIDAMKPGRYQPRTRMNAEALDELASSIKAQGLMQPVLVRIVGRDGMHEIIAGERRWRASQMAGLTEIPALIRDVPDTAAAAQSLIENIQREDLNPIEEARGFQRLIDEFQLTHEQVAQAVGRSRSAISNALRLTELASAVQDLLGEGRIDMGHARALHPLPPEQQVMLAQRIALQGLTVRDAERLAQESLAAEVKADAGGSSVDQRPGLGTNGSSRNGSTMATTRDPDLQRLETDLSDTLGATVRIKSGTKGRGRIVIDYSSLDQLDGILARMR
jgi:ParB family chromosome partitioning protein